MLGSTEKKTGTPWQTDPLAVEESVEAKERSDPGSPAFKGIRITVLQLRFTAHLHTDENGCLAHGNTGFASRLGLYVADGDTPGCGQSDSSAENVTAKRLI